MAPTDPCPIPFARSVAALRVEGQALGPVVDAITDFHAPTRLGAWRVRELLAHLTRAFDRLGHYLRAPSPPDPEVDWITYWDRAAAADPAAIAARAEAQAARHTDRELVAAFRAAAADALELLGEADPGRTLPTPFGTMRLDHYLTTRVVELTVHGLDLRHALGLEEVATPTALDVTCAVLDALLGGPRPDGLDDPCAWILVATGRTPHPDPRLPVLR